MNDIKTVKEEVKVAKANMPGIAWPTIILGLGLLATFVSFTFLAVTDQIAIEAAAIINTFVLYAIYTPLHDAVHSAIVPRNKNLKWINTVVGMMVSIPLWMFFHHHRKQHFVHHSKTNEPGDTDLWAKGTFCRVFFIQIPLLLASSFNPVLLYRDCLKLNLHSKERRLTMSLFVIYAAVVMLIIYSGHATELVILWLVPWFIGLLFMQTLFGWAPHHDHSETGRYRNTRIALWPFAGFLTLQQNLHLVHHMLPTVPFYRYRTVFDKIRPLLEQHGARIEGFWPKTPLA